MRSKQRKLWGVNFTVRGQGPFPRHLLNDRCGPATPEDVQWMRIADEKPAKIVELMLTSYARRRVAVLPDLTAWKEAGWPVTEIYTSREITKEKHHV